MTRRGPVRAVLAAAVAVAAGFAAVLLVVAHEQQPDAAELRARQIRAGYAKYEARIPMRDGVRLFTAIYVPNDRSRRHPILLLRTPYGATPYGADRYRRRLGPTEAFEQDGYIFVIQDVRGRFMSEGEFVQMRPHVADKANGAVDESSDAYDTIDWLLENVEGHNGRVGQWGVSYPGFYTSAGLIDSHPALVAASPQAPIADWWFDDVHRNGAFNLALTFNFLSRAGVRRDGPTASWPERFDHGTPDGYQFFLDLGPLRNVNERHFHGEIAFWNDIAAHPNYDEFWRRRNILPHLRGVGASVLVIGGWYDTEDLYGPLQTYASIEDRNPGAENVLVMGPWAHGAWIRGRGERLGSTEFGFPTAEAFREQILEPFFRSRLIGMEPSKLPEATVFETGANRWRTFDAWPPKGLERRSLYFAAGGRLAHEPPMVVARRETLADDFVSDPAKPVPYTMEITTRWARDYMTEDQRFAAWRPDVLVYRSEPLEADVTLAGPLEPDLWVSTSRTDADWVVKLVDEHPGRGEGDDRESAGDYPGGRQELVRGTPFRGRFRESFERPVPFEPGVPARVRFRIDDVLHTFKRGHRIMIQVQSSWFPFIDRNPQTFVPNIFEAREQDFVRATHTVHRSPNRPSRVVVGVLEGGVP